MFIENQNRFTMRSVGSENIVNSFFLTSNTIKVKIFINNLDNMNIENFIFRNLEKIYN